MTSNKRKPMANPMVIFREENNGSAVLLDTDSNKTYGLNPVSAFIWKMLKGNNTKEIILAALKQECNGKISENVVKDFDSFINELEKNSLINYEE